ncbi:MAG: isopentenyl-diphosphate Delta-isomerase [Pseudomonadales bacterium]
MSHSRETRRTRATKTDIVSSESEALILVDPADRVVGHLDKSAAHDGDGVLHRAFSLFIFNADGALLLQQRAPGKRLWPEFWSNSCCSHPRQGESMDEAVHRRLEQELGMKAELSFTYKFEYHARFGTLGSEHELCWVYVGATRDEPVINTTEIMDWRWIEPAELTRAIEAEPHRYTPWLKMEWERLNSEFAARLPDSASVPG